MIIYWILDVVVTLVSVCVFYLLNIAICKKQRFRGANLVATCVLFIAIYMFSWHILIPKWKMWILIVWIVIAGKLAYKDSLYKILIVTMLLQMIEGVATAIAAILAYEIDETFCVNVGEKLFAIPIVYLIIIFIELVIGILLFIRTRNFRYEFAWKDFLFMLMIYVPLFFFNNNNRVVSIINKSSTWFDRKVEMLSIICNVIFLLCFLDKKNYYHLRDRNEEAQIHIAQLQQQFTYFQEKQEDERRIRSIYHDMKNHLLVLQANGSDNSMVQQSISKLQEQMQVYENYYRTGNEFLDVIICEKARIAKEKQIDFSPVIHFEDGSFIDLLDVSTIYGNALDNAIEASENVSEEQRCIIVKTKRVQNMLVIVFENVVSSSVSLKKKTIKNDTFLHGFGILNIKNAVEKYDGHCNVQLADNIFSMKIVIPIPEKQIHN